MLPPGAGSREQQQQQQLAGGAPLLMLSTALLNTNDNDATNCNNHNNHNNCNVEDLVAMVAEVDPHSHPHEHEHAGSGLATCTTATTTTSNNNNTSPADEAEDALDTILESSVADMDAALNAAEEHPVVVETTADSTTLTLLGLTLPTTSTVTGITPHPHFPQSQPQPQDATIHRNSNIILLDAQTQRDAATFVPPNSIINGQRRGRWTLDEKLLFLYGLQQFGKGRWKKISAYIPHRSLVQIKSHAQKVLQRHAAGDAVFRRLEEHASQLHSLLVQAHVRLGWEPAPTREQLAHLVTTVLVPPHSIQESGRTMQPAQGKRRRQPPAAPEAPATTTATAATAAVATTTLALEQSPPLGQSPPSPPTKKKKGPTEQILAASALCRLAGSDEDDDNNDNDDEEQQQHASDNHYTDLTHTATVDLNKEPVHAMDDSLNGALAEAANAGLVVETTTTTNNEITTATTNNDEPDTPPLPPSIPVPDMDAEIV